MKNTKRTKPCMKKKEKKNIKRWFMRIKENEMRISEKVSNKVLREMTGYFERREKKYKRRSV